MSSKKKKANHKIETRAAMAGLDPAAQFGFVNPPVYRGSTVLFESAETLRTVDQPYIYARRGTPTLTALQDAMCELEGAHGVIAAPSGLAAITACLLAFLGAGDHILVSDSVYRPTRRFCDGVLARYGVETEYFDPLIGGDIKRHLKTNTAVVFTEAPGSQTMEMSDIPAIAAAARDGGATVIMDNTWATPVYFKPLDHGVDVSIVAATKFLGGHSDLMLGVASANEQNWARLHDAGDRLGIYAGPDDVSLVLRGLRTLPLRLERHMRSGLEVARWLRERPEVGSVLYPALEDDPGHAIWSRDFHGAPGVFSVVLEPVPELAVNAFLNALDLFGMGWSWGGFESLIVPFDPSGYRSAGAWPHKGPALRLHVGLENSADLIADLEQGFGALAAFTKS